MRDLLIIAIVVMAAMVALRRPWIGVLLWVWVSIMNPHRYTYGFAYDAPVAMLAAATTLVGLLMTRDKESPFKAAPSAWLAAFAVWITVSWLLGLDPAGDYEQWDKVMKIFLMVFIAMALIRTKMQILVLCWVLTMSITLLGAKGGLFTVMTGGSYRVWGPEGSFVFGNNEFAVAQITAIPLLRFMQLQATRKWLRWLLGTMILLCAASALGSHSRGALLALTGMAVVLWWRGTNRPRNAVIMVVLGMVMVAFMPDNWSQRMDTIETYQEDMSAMGRFSAWWVSWRVAFDYPTGIGFYLPRPELFLKYSPYPELGTPVAHSNWFQVLGHHGFPGLAIYLLLGLSTWLAANRLRAVGAADPALRWCGEFGGMAQVSLVGFAIGGSFLQLAYYDFPYYVMALVVLVHAWVQRRLWLSEPASVDGWRRLIGVGQARPGPGAEAATQPRGSRRPAVVRP
jgi:putative inorganic carbon (hco3(-)) transporter